MQNIFIQQFKKNRKIFGLLVSLITSVAFVNSFSDYLSLVQKQWIIFPFTVIMTIFLYVIYLNMVRR